LEKLRGAIESSGVPFRVRPAALDIVAAHRASESAESGCGAPARHALEPHPSFFHPQNIFVPTAQVPQLL